MRAAGDAGTIEIVSPSFDRRRVLVQVADVFVVQVDVDEAAQLAFIVEELLAQVGILRGQRGQHFADGGAGELDGILLARRTGAAASGSELWPLVNQLLFFRFGLVEIRQPAIGVVEFALLNR